MPYYAAFYVGLQYLPTYAFRCHKYARIKQCEGFSEFSLLINVMNILLQGHTFDFFVGYIDESRKFEGLGTRGFISKYRKFKI